MDSQNLNHKVILITGACGLIATKLIKSLYDKAYRLVLVDVDQHQLDILFSELMTERCLCIEANLLNFDSHCDIIKLAVKKFKKIDCVINLAYPKSKYWGTPFGKLSHSHVMEDLNNQLVLPIMFSQAVMNLFLRQNFGNLIHVSSIQGVSAPKFEHYEGTKMVSPIEYTAVKSAIIAITKYLAKLYKGKNIRVNCVSPGGVLDAQPDTFLKKYNSSCVNKGMLDPQDLIGAFQFLISDESKYITGQNIIVDDGWTL